MGIAEQATRDALAKDGPGLPILGPDEVAGENDVEFFLDEAIPPRKRYIENLDADAREVETQGPGGPYASLAGILADALKQASSGKGAERHANNKPFEDQPIMQITRLLDGHPVGPLAYQAIKKIIESGRIFYLHGAEAAVKEIEGSINYAAGVALRFRELGTPK